MQSDYPRLSRSSARPLPMPIRPEPVSILPRRRRKPDLWVRVPKWLGIAAFVVALAALAWADAARPNWRGIGLDGFFGVSRRDRWDVDALYVAFGMLAFSFAACGVGLLMRSRRMKRAEDRIPWSLVILMLLSGVAALGYLSLIL